MGGQVGEDYAIAADTKEFFEESFHIGFGVCPYGITQDAYQEGDI